MFHRHQIELESEVDTELWRLPLFLEGLCAGCPAPADGHVDREVDLSQLIMPNKPATCL